MGKISVYSYKNLFLLENMDLTKTEIDMLTSSLSVAMIKKSKSEKLSRHLSSKASHTKADTSKKF